MWEVGGGRREAAYGRSAPVRQAGMYNDPDNKKHWTIVRRNVTRRATKSTANESQTARATANAT